MLVSVALTVVKFPVGAVMAPVLVIPPVLIDVIVAALAVRVPVKLPLLELTLVEFRVVKFPTGEAIDTLADSVVHPTAPEDKLPTVTDPENVPVLEFKVVVFKVVRFPIGDVIDVVPDIAVPRITPM